MSLQFDITAQNAMLQALQAAIGPAPKLQFFAGLVPINCAAPVTGMLLATFQLAPAWASAPVGGVYALSNLPLQSIAVATGQAGYFRIVDALGICHQQGTVTGAGLGGDFELDNPNITVGQTITVGAWTVTAPGS